MIIASISVIYNLPNPASKLLTTVITRKLRSPFRLIARTCQWVRCKLTNYLLFMRWEKRMLPKRIILERNKLLGIVARSAWVILKWKESQCVCLSAFTASIRSASTNGSNKTVNAPCAKPTKNEYESKNLLTRIVINLISKNITNLYFHFKVHKWMNNNIINVDIVILFSKYIYFIW